MSFTGLAYVDGLRSDTWIADQLDPSVNHKEHPALRVAGKEKQISTGLAIERLAAAMAISVPIQQGASSAGGLTVDVVGFRWQEARGVDIPFRWVISNPGLSPSTTTVSRLPKYWGWERNRYCTGAVGDRRRDPISILGRRLSGITELFADTVEKEMVDTIREVSRLGDGTIGEDCISVLYPHNADPARVRYFSSDSLNVPHRLYTPWVLFPGVGSLAPAVSDGSAPTMNLGPLSVIFVRDDNPEAPGGLSTYSSYPPSPR
jgi:hypothetical protein